MKQTWWIVGVLAVFALTSGGWPQFASTGPTFLAGSDKKDDEEQEDRIILAGSDKKDEDEEEEEIVLSQDCDPGFKELVQSGNRRDSRRGFETQHGFA